MSAPQNLHETFSLFFCFGTIWSRPHLGQVRLSRRIAVITVENITPIGVYLPGFHIAVEL